LNEGRLQEIAIRFNTKMISPSTPFSGDLNKFREPPFSVTGAPQRSSDADL
jgi:hypothetical protein